MELVCPDQVTTNHEFSCQLLTNPSPDVPISAFRTVLAFPFDSAISYESRPCHAEVLVTYPGDQPVVTCVQELSGNVVFHGAGSDPPVPGLFLDVPASSSGTPLLQVSSVCKQPGVHTLRLLPEGSKEYGVGTGYFDETGQLLSAKVNSQDILCEGDRPPTPTRPPEPSAHPPEATVVGSISAPDAGERTPHDQGLLPWLAATGTLAAALAVMLALYRSRR
jgi:hypothetical protein